MPDTSRERVVMLAHDEGKEIEYRIHGDDAWRPTPAPAWNWASYDYRVKPTKQRVPRTMDDLPKGGALWVRQVGGRCVKAVTHIDPHGIIWDGTNSGQDTELECGVAAYDVKNKIEITSDRETWLPWWKEVEA